MGRGGTALIEAAGQLARRQGCARLWVITTNDNVDALRFYQRRGFCLVRVHRGAVDRSRATHKPEIPAAGAGSRCSMRSSSSDTPEHRCHVDRYGAVASFLAWSVLAVRPPCRITAGQPGEPVEQRRMTLLLANDLSLVLLRPR